MRTCTIAMTRACCAAAVLMIVPHLGAVPADHRLADAAERRDRAAIHTLLTEHADVNARQGDGATALHWAVHWDDGESVEELIEADADVNAENDYGVTPLSLACTNGNAAIAERLLRAGANPNTARSTGETALMTAARAGHVPIVSALIERGADVNAREKVARQTALMWAAAQGHAEVTRVLLQQGADVHSRSMSGFTALLFAAREGDTATARLLLAAGAEINERAPDGSSTLLVATASAQESVALLLLEKGADPNLADAIGYTPLHATVWKPSAKQGLYRPEGSTKLVTALLAGGANVGARIAKDPPAVPGSFNFQSGLVGATPYWLAAKAGNASVMRALAAGGADVTLATKDGTTPLMVAAGLGQGQGPGSVPESKLREAVMAAVDSGASVNAINDNGQTALHGAAGQGFDTIIQYLADHGADLNVKDKRGQSALTSALRRNASPSSTIDLLLELGARAGSDSPDATPGARPAAFAPGSGRGVQSLAIDNVHLRVADPREAAAWYVKYFGATPAPDPGQVLFGKTLIAFVRTEAMQPSAGSVIDHIALSYADLDAAMKALVGSGAKVVSPPVDDPGLFKAAFVEDPWGAQIEVLEDADLLGFHHVHVRVPRPEATLAWFESLLGGTRDKLKGRVEGLRYGRVWLLVTPSGTAAPEPSALRAIQNIAWQIPDITRAADAFQRAGVKTVIPPRALGDLWYAFFEDPNGIRVELIQRPPQP